jgi:hypothetical protein
MTLADSSLLIAQLFGAWVVGFAAGYIVTMFKRASSQAV